MPSSPTVIDMHGAQPHDVVVSEYFTGLRNMTRWSKDAVEGHDQGFCVGQFVEMDAIAKKALERAFRCPLIC